MLLLHRDGKCVLSRRVGRVEGRVAAAAAAVEVRDRVSVILRFLHVVGVGIVQRGLRLLLCRFSCTRMRRLLFQLIDALVSLSQLLLRLGQLRRLLL